jgi:hypothetical protein
MNIQTYKLPVGMDDPQVYKKLLRDAGRGFGLLFGLCYVLFTWGYDAWQLIFYSVAMPWAKLSFGLPLVVILCVLLGWGAAWSNSTAITLGIWVFGGWIIGFLSGHLPFEGNNLVAWLLDPRFLGENIFSFHGREPRGGHWRCS